MDDRVSLDLTLNEWLYLLAVLAPFAVAVTGLVLAAVARKWEHRWPALTLAVAGGGGWAIAVLAGLDRSPIHFLPVQLKLVLSDLLLVAVVGGAFVIGVVIAAIVYFGWRSFGGRGAGSTAAALLAPGVLVLVALGGLLFLLDERTAPRVGHPVLTVIRPGVSATVLADGLDFPVTLAVSPEGDVYFGELISGRVARIPAGPGSSPETVFTVDLPPVGQLIRMALHPDWPNPRQVFVTAQQEVDGRLFLHLLRGDAGNPEAGLTPLLEGLPTTQPDGGNHTGGAITFCAGYLYVSIGDTQPFFTRTDIRHFVQDPFRAEGKLLRYRLEGDSLEPAGVLSQEPPVYAMGFRNPWGMGCDPGTGYPVVADNGPIGHDQVRVVRPGSNHEWPFSPERRRLGPPMYDTGDRPIVPTGVVVQGIGSAREVFVSAHETSAVYRLLFTADPNVARSLEVVYSPPSGALALAEDAAGCLYVSDSTSIARIRLGSCQ